MPAASETCRTCKFCAAMQPAEPVKKDDEQGACRRNPPILLALPGTVQSNFPLVRLDWFCGEWKRRGR